MNRLREKTTATILIALFMISAFAIAAYAVDGTHLVATTGGPGTGTEDRIVIDVPDDFTLGMLESISWDEYLVAGYPPHVDVILDLDDNGEYTIADEALVFEYAYNYESHALTEAPMPYGALTGAWYATFSDDTYGPAVIDDEAMAWATKGAPGPLGGDFGDDNFFYLSLADWKAGVTYQASGQAEKTINSDSIILRLEIEVDNWVVDSDAYVDNILVNELSETELNLEASVIPAIVSISVSPTTVNFGSIIFGEDSDVEVVTVTNAGNVVATITADIDSQFYQDYLEIDEVPYASPWNLGTISAGSFEDYDLQLMAVLTMGTHSGVLVFEATPPTP